MASTVLSSTISSSPSSSEVFPSPSTDASPAPSSPASLTPMSPSPGASPQIRHPKIKWDDIRDGDIVYLRELCEIDQAVLAGSGVEELSLNHPCVVLRKISQEDPSDPCNGSAQIAHMTSFGQSDLSAKSPAQQTLHLPIAPAPDHPMSAEGYPTLHLMRATLKKNSYVKLHSSYTAPLSMLRPYNPRGLTPRLQQNSLQAVKEWIVKQAGKATSNSRRSSLNRRTPSPLISPVNSSPSTTWTPSPPIPQVNSSALTRGAPSHPIWSANSSLHGQTMFNFGMPPLPPSPFLLGRHPSGLGYVWRFPSLDQFYQNGERIEATIRGPSPYFAPSLTALYPPPPMPYPQPVWPPVRQTQQGSYAPGPVCQPLGY